MTRRCLRGLLPALAALLATACVTAPPGNPAGGWTSGRLVVRVDATPSQPARQVSTAFDLRGDPGQGELRLTGPLGSRLATARWTASAAVLVTAEGERAFADVDALAREAVGEALPLAALPDWLAGRPWPAAPHRRGENGFEQLGWQVDLSRHADGWIEARRGGSPAVSVRVRLDPAER